VSEKHANFIVADPGATAADVWALIERVRALVADEAGVRLEPEVQVLGEVAGAAG
jgi:UDP-N-acetylmuramate dehydrogenase